MFCRALRLALFGMLSACAIPLAHARGDEPATVTLDLPPPWQVVQREGYVPARAHEHQPGGPELGYADVPIAGPLTVPDGARTEYRIVRLVDAFGRETDWARFTGEATSEGFTGRVRVPAGGWYRLEVRVVAGEKIVSTARVEPIGVGEVFVVAGQSYAAGANDELLRVAEPQGRVVCLDVVERKWRVAHDPQPHVSDGGTIWPALGDLLVPLLRVPVGFVNVAVGGTASRQWLPGEKLYENLVAAGRQAGRFRAILWQQGESDVIEGVSTEKYVQHLTAMRAGLAREWGTVPPWLLAKSTLHPTVYKKPEGEAQIREAIDHLARMPGFRPGPDTDTLGGENRGGIGTRRHFSGIGQRRAALLWFAAVWPELQRAAPLDQDEAGFTPLFNGTDLDGWEGDLKLWKVENNAIVGDSAGISHNEFLATRGRYSDFELRLEFKLLGGRGNSGVQFRSERVAGSREVAGYQADLGEKYWGCLYDESRRNKVLVQAPAELAEVLRPEDWNSYTIRAEGPRIRLKINGLQTVEYTEPENAIPRTGVIALQVHSGPALRVEFRRLRIKELAPRP